MLKTSIFHLNREEQDISTTEHVIENWHPDSGTPIIQDGIVDHVASTRKHYLTRGDASQDSLYKKDEKFVSSKPIRSEIAIPIIDSHDEHDEVIGVLNLEAYDIYTYREEHVAILQIFTRQVALALKSYKTYHDLQQSNKHTAALNDLTDKLNSIDLTELLAEYEQGISIHNLGYQRRLKDAYKALESTLMNTLLGAEVMVWRVVEHGDASAELRLHSRSRPLSITPIIRSGEAGRGYNNHVWATSTDLLILDCQKRADHEVSPSPDESQWCSWVITPIRYADRYYGNLSLCHEQVAYFTAQHRDFVVGAGQQLAIFIHRLESFRQAKDEQRSLREMRSMTEARNIVADVRHKMANLMGPNVEMYYDDLHEALKQVPDDGLQSQSLQRLKALRERTDTLKNYILDISLHFNRYQDAQIADMREVFDIQEIIDGAWSHTPPENITLEIFQTDNLPHVQAVPTDVQSILFHLIDNAMQLLGAREGGGHITVRTGYNDEWVYVDVEDDGEGIPLNKEEAIFGLGFTTRPGGTGFGLNYSRTMARLNLGELAVDSPRNPTRFRLLLPRAKFDVNWEE